MVHLINENEIKDAGFQISEYLGSLKLETCINEAEKIHVKPRITDALYLDLLKWTVEDTKNFPPEYEVLMNGGEFVAMDDCRQSNIRCFDGLKTAVKYYAYARLIKKANDNLTRFGFVVKTDEYSQKTEYKKQLAAYEDALHTADIFMSDCIAYLNANKNAFPLFKKAGIAKNRLSIKIIK